jgi:hypothetical protein
MRGSLAKSSRACSGRRAAATPSAVPALVEWRALFLRLTSIDLTRSRPAAQPSSPALSLAIRRLRRPPIPREPHRRPTNQPRRPARIRPQRTPASPLAASAPVELLAIFDRRSKHSARPPPHPCSNAFLAAQGPLRPFARSVPDAAPVNWSIAQRSTSCHSCARQAPRKRLFIIGPTRVWLFIAVGDRDELESKCSL